MSIYKILSLAAVSGLLAISASPVYAKGFDESIVAQERNQLGNFARPDVDPVSAHGGQSIVSEEHDQLGNFARPDVDPVSARGGESLVDLEKQQIPGGY